MALKARENESQVLMVCGHMNEALNMSKALKDIGWKPKAFYASVGPALQDFYDQGGAAAEAVLEHHFGNQNPTIQVQKSLINNSLKSMAVHPDIMQASPMQQARF